MVHTELPSGEKVAANFQGTAVIMTPVLTYVQQELHRHVTEGTCRTSRELVIQAYAYEII